MNQLFLRKSILTALAGAGVLSASIAAADVSNLVVVRASNDTLWKATCNGNVCSGFTNFPGLFGSQPTVTWDESQARYVLFGTASNGTIWRSTFNADGVFLNDWVQLAGIAASPPGAAGGGAARQFGTTYPVASNNAMLSTDLAFTPRNILTRTFTPPFAQGYYQCTATAIASINRVNAAGTNVVFLGMSETSATIENSARWSAIDLPDGTPAGLTTIPISVSAWFEVDSTAQRSYFLTAQWGGTSATGGANDSIELRMPSFFCTYQPYLGG